tara:strand:- start:46146 stop:46556 length:411 start_codon:yes stop_codon:yes gene_type:complete
LGIILFWSSGVIPKLALIMETVTIGYIVIGILVVVLLLQRKRIDKNAEFDSYNHNWTDELKDWSIMTSFSELKLLSKYAGELRFGPAFLHLKTEPKMFSKRNSSEIGFTEQKTEFIYKSGILIRLKAEFIQEQIMT